jgi:hypothetical protein
MTCWRCTIRMIRLLYVRRDAVAAWLQISCPLWVESGLRHTSGIGQNMNYFAEARNRHHPISAV